MTVVVHGTELRALDARAAGVAQGLAYPRLETLVAEPLAAGTAASLNRAAARADGDLLLFLAHDVDIGDEGFLDALVTYAGLPSVGIVAPVSVHPDGRVDHAGLTLRRGGTDDGGDRLAWWHGGAPVAPVMRGAPGDSDGYYGSLSCAREVAAVPASCMLVARTLFERAEGFDEQYRIRYHDVDLCLRVRRMGLGVVCTPRPRAVSRATSPDGAGEDVVDRALLVDSWFDELDRGDPYLSSDLSAAMTPIEPDAGGRLAPLRRLAGLR